MPDAERNDEVGGWRDGPRLWGCGRAELWVLRALLRVVGDVIILEWKEGVIFTCILGSLIPVRFMGKVKIVIFFGGTEGIKQGRLESGNCMIGPCRLISDGTEKPLDGIHSGRWKLAGETVGRHSPIGASMHNNIVQQGLVMESDCGE